jgi:site-specific recombinase XerD
LSRVVESPRIYSHEGLPSYPYWEDINRLLENTHTDKAIDIRDYAILLLLSIYGLRSSEVVQLKLKDIDWNKECIHIQRAKNGNVQIFPLVQSVGEAIIRYLKNVRPNLCGLQEIFVCYRAPYRPILPGSIHTIVYNRLKPLNLNIRHHGAHALRHGCATHLMNEGLTLEQINSHLGHKHLESTRIYAKVDLSNLRKVADIDWSVIL